MAVVIQEADDVGEPSSRRAATQATDGGGDPSSEWRQQPRRQTTVMTQAADSRDDPNGKQRQPKGQIQSL